MGERYLHEDFRPPKHGAPAGSLCASPVLIPVDPGGTTGCAIWQVHPEALVDPDVKILENVQYWWHGQIDCGSQKGNAGDSPAKAIEELRAEEAGELLNGKHIEYLEEFEPMMGAEPLGISTTGENSGVSEMLRLIGEWPGAATLMEDFILGKFNQGRDLLSPVRITEKISFGLWVMGRVEVPRQSASLAKTTVTDARLKSWGFYQRDGGMNHARDADRHGITFLRRCKDGLKGKRLREMAWPHLYGKDGPYYIADARLKRRTTAS